MHKLTTTAITDIHIFGLELPRNMNNTVKPEMFTTILFRHIFIPLNVFYIVSVKICRPKNIHFTLYQMKAEDTLLLIIQYLRISLVLAGCITYVEISKLPYPKNFDLLQWSTVDRQRVGLYNVLFG